MHCGVDPAEIERILELVKTRERKKKEEDILPGELANVGNDFEEDINSIARKLPEEEAVAMDPGVHECGGDDDDFPKPTDLGPGKVAPYSDGDSSSEDSPEKPAGKKPKSAPR